MELTDVQKQAVRQWVAAGAGLSDVQKRLSGEFGVKATYMDVRFLVLELGVQLQEKQGRSAPPSALPAKDEESDMVPEPAFEEESLQSGAVTVEVDRIMKPGAMVSGSVVFSDGTRGAWMLDQFGRVALDTGRPDYRPSPADVRAFQTQLRKALESKGF